MTIAVDFDGTIVTHAFPRIGKEIPFAVDTLKTFIAEGHRVILWTSRSGENLKAAVDWCADRGLVFYAVNSNYPEHSIVPIEKRRGSPKVVADVYIDDRNLGGLPEWGIIYSMVTGHSKKYIMTNSRRVRLKLAAFFDRLLALFTRHQRHDEKDELHTNV